MPKILIIGNPQQGHVGSHFLEAANYLGFHADLIDLHLAWHGSRWKKKFYYHLLGKRPTALKKFAGVVFNFCRVDRPDILLVTGIAPPDAMTLKQIAGLGIKCVNYLTDDPWNPANGARFFWDALPEYDLIASPRTSNMADLRVHGCRRVEFLPFAYHPPLHFYEPPVTNADKKKFSCEIALVGGADQDRLLLGRAILQAGLDLKVYGGYWDKYREFKHNYGGFVLGSELRMAVAGATVNLCMGRKANRDGHAMRSLELPAMGGCVLAEKTEEHLAIFGEETDVVSYYSSLEELVTRAKELADDKNRAKQMESNLRKKILSERNTYADRLVSIVDDVFCTRNK